MQNLWWHGYVIVNVIAPLQGDQVMLVRSAFQQLSDLNATEPQFKYAPRMNLAGNQWVLEARWNMGAIIALTPQGIIAAIQDGIAQELGEAGMQGVLDGVDLYAISSCTFMGLNDANGDPIVASGIEGATDNFMSEVGGALARDSSWEGSHAATLAYLDANRESWEVSAP